MFRSGKELKLLISNLISILNYLILGFCSLCKMRKQGGFQHSITCYKSMILKATDETLLRLVQTATSV